MIHTLTAPPAFLCTEILIGTREVIGRLADGSLIVIARLIEPEAVPPPKRKHRKKVFAPTPVENSHELNSE
jgi:hypothetical protein